MTQTYLMLCNLLLLLLLLLVLLVLLLLLLLLLPGAELSLTAENFGLLNDLLLPFLSILGASYPIFDLHLANVLFDFTLPSILGSFL